MGSLGGGVEHIVAGVNIGGSDVGKQSLMHTNGGHKRQHSGQHGNHDPAHRTIECKQAAGEGNARIVAQRSEEEQLKRYNHQETHHRHKNDAHRLRADFGEILFHKVQSEYGKDGRENLRSVRNVRHGQAKDGQTVADQAGKLGQQGHGGNDHCVHLVAFQLGGTGIGDHDRQEIEGCVGNVEHDLIQVAAFVHPARHGQQGEQGLDQAAAGNHADQRLESANQEIEHKVADLLFGGRCIVVRDDACTLQLTGLLQGFVHFDHIVADDHLQLALQHDAHHTGHLFQCVKVGFAVVLQGKAQTCGAVCKLRNICFAANKIQNLFGRALVIQHVVLLSFGRGTVQRLPVHPNRMSVPDGHSVCLFGGFSIAATSTTINWHNKTKCAGRKRSESTMKVRFGGLFAEKRLAETTFL